MCDVLYSKHSDNGALTEAYDEETNKVCKDDENDDEELDREMVIEEGGDEEGDVDF